MPVNKIHVCRTGLFSDLPYKPSCLTRTSHTALGIFAFIVTVRSPWESGPCPNLQQVTEQLTLSAEIEVPSRHLRALPTSWALARSYIIYHRFKLLLSSQSIFQGTGNDIKISLGTVAKHRATNDHSQHS